MSDAQLLRIVAGPQLPRILSNRRQRRAQLERLLGGGSRCRSQSARSRAISLRSSITHATPSRPPSSAGTGEIVTATVRFVPAAGSDTRLRLDAVRSFSQHGLYFIRQANPFIGVRVGVPMPPMPTRRRAFRWSQISAVTREALCGDAPHMEAGAAQRGLVSISATFRPNCAPRMAPYSLPVRRQ